MVIRNFSAGPKTFDFTGDLETDTKVYEALGKWIRETSLGRWIPVKEKKASDKTIEDEGESL